MTSPEVAIPSVTVPVIDIYDTVGANVIALPAGQQAAGYTTGSGAVPWTPAQFAAHTTPHPAVRIDQDPSARDYTADLLDVEANAATVAEIVRWITGARANFNAGLTSGQRWPGIYVGLSNLDAAIANLKAANITDVPFGIPDLTNRADAVTKVSTASTGFYRVWQQYQFGPSYDSGIVSVPWLTKVSKVATPNPTPRFSIAGVPGEWEEAVVVTGKGVDGNLYIVVTKDGKSFTAPVKVLRSKHN